MYMKLLQNLKVSFDKPQKITLKQIYIRAGFKRIVICMACGRRWFSIDMCRQTVDILI